MRAVRIQTALRAAALAASVAGLLPTRAQAVEPGRMAPAISLVGRQGAPLQLADYRGKVVWLDFWASWCGPCRKSFPWMNDMQAKYGPRGLQVVAVNLDARAEDAHAFLADVPATFTVAFDRGSVAARSFKVQGMPTSVLIGADGKVLLQHSGFRDGDPVELEKRIQAALGAAR